MPICDVCGRTSVTGNICHLCALKGPAKEFEQAVSINLQINTVEDMVRRFVIDNHQVKHYAGGAREYSHFDSRAGGLTWHEVHQIIVYSAGEILKLQRAAGLLKPCLGYVQFEDLAARDEWYAGAGRGYTNVVKVQLRTSLKDGFEGHGGPLDLPAFQEQSKDAFAATGSIKNARKVQLSGANNSVRIMRIGG